MTKSPLMHRANDTVIIAVAAVLGALVFSWPLAADPAGTLPAPGDSKVQAWVLGWVAERAKYGLLGVWDAPIFFPYRNTLAWGEPLLGIGVPLAPLYWLGANAVLLHNLAVWASFAIAATGGYALGRELSGSRTGGVVCGAVAAFLPYRLSHLSHVQVLMGAWLWWAAWSVHRYFRAPSLGAALRAAALYALLGLSSLYWIYICALPLAAIALVECWRVRAALRPLVLHAAAAGALCLLVFLPLARQMRAVSAPSSPIGTTTDAFSYSADVASYASVHRLNVIWRGVLPHGDGESDLFPGAVLLACAVMAVRYRPPVSRMRDRWTLVYALLAATAVVLSLGPAPALNGRPLFENPVLPWLSRHVAGFDRIRALSRFVIVAQLALSVLAARGVAAWLAGRPPSLVTRRVTAAVLAAIVFSEGLALPIGVVALSPLEGAGRRVTHWLAQRPGGAVIELPLDGWKAGDQVMGYQARVLLHGHPIVQGVTRYSPPLPTLLADTDSPLTAPERVAAALPFLRALGVRFVVVHEDLYGDRAVGAVMRAAFVESAGGAAAEFAQTSIIDLGEPGPLNAQEPMPEIEPAAMSVSAAIGHPAHMLDGDPDRRWHTARPQQASDHVDITLASPQSVSGLRLRMSGPTLLEYPRALQVLTAETIDGPWEQVFSGSVLDALGAGIRRDPVAPVIELRWAPRHARHVRLQQTGESTRWAWSIGELRLVRPAE